VTSLRCTLRRAFAFLSLPLDTAVLSPFPFHPSPAVSARTTSVQKEQLLSRTASRATRRCKCSSRLLGARTGPKCSPLCQRPLTLCAAFTASRLGRNSIGGYYKGHKDRGLFVSITDGIVALCEGLKGSAVTSLECAAAPKCLPFCQRPLTCLLPSHHLRFSPHPPQSRGQRDQVRGRLRARRHPQGDADHSSEVRCRPSVCFCVNAR
jgi:hypothetical protein